MKISHKLDEFGANILIIPRSDDLALSYGGMSIGGVSIDAQTLKDSDIPKIRQIEVRENISTVSPKLIGVIEIEGKKVPLMGIQFPGRSTVEEVVEDPRCLAEESGRGPAWEARRR